MLRRLFILILPLFLFFCNSFAERGLLQISQQLTISDKLSHNGVTSIFEDSRAYLWIGTFDGLNRYNGYEFKVYKNTIKNKIFSSNRIRTISEDRKNNLWIGTDNGVTVYNYSEDKFSNIYSNKDAKGELNGPTVRKVVMNDDNNLIICTTLGEGILVFKSNYGFVSNFIPAKKISKNPIEFFDGIALDEFNYLFLSTAGLIHFNLKTEQFTVVYENNMRQHGSLLKLNGNKLLATLSHGLGIFTFNKKGDGYTFKLDAIKMHEYVFRGASVDSYGNLWLGVADKGVLHVDNVRALLENRRYKTKIYLRNRGRIRVSCLYTSDRSGCWVGSFDKGIVRFNLKEHPFKKYDTNLKYGLDQGANSISHISAFDTSRAFLSAGRGGLVLFNTLTHKFESLPTDFLSMGLNNITSIFIDSEGAYWLQSKNNRVCRLRKGSKELEKITMPRIGHIRTITEDKQGNIWFGDINHIHRILLDKNRAIINIESLNNNPFFRDNNYTLFRRIYADPLFGFVWLGSDIDGLFRISINKNTLLKDAKVDHFVQESKDPHSISSNFVSSILRLPNNELWIGTEGGGIYKVLASDKEPEFIAFGEENGLSNNVVKSMLYDEEQNLWISTNIGLNRFNTKDQTFMSFRAEDGLPFEAFMYASEKLDNGFMFFSGINNLCYFNPQQTLDKEILPDLIFSDFKIHNKSIFPSDTIKNRVLLNKPITDLDEIKLKYNENVFSLELTSLHYGAPENHYLKYKLLPVNQEWVEVPSNQRTINYNGLQPGEYELRVMASNSRNEWTKAKMLKIIIEPPLWSTAPAFLLYLFVIALLIYSIMYYILRMNKLSHKLEIEHLEKESVKEVNAAKLRFFSNISHEIKTPLTLISGPVNGMAERYKGNTDLNEKLKMVQRQSKKIAQLIDQVHDFQRSDANKLEMNYSVFYFNDFINKLAVDFHFLADNNKKKLEVLGDNSTIYIWADMDKLEKILNNLLSNAFKYTKEKDTVTIEYRRENKDLYISVSDTGKGIAPDDLPHIFERFYQSKHKHSAYTGGAGIGLAFAKRLVEMHYGLINAESVLLEGTTVRVKLPIITEQPENVYLETQNRILSEEKNCHENALEKESVDTSKIDVDSEFSGTKIFFAEDNLDMQKYVSETLANFYQLTAFTNGKELIDAMNHEWPDIVISDVLMPEMNGFELCKRIKSNIKTSHIPVLLLTACTTIEEQLTGLKQGADSYIKKPFNVQYLITSIESLLRNRKQLRERFQIDLPLTMKKNESLNNDMLFLEKLYALMEENLNNADLDMDMLARKMFVNRTYFYHNIKVITNNTPYELFKIYRLKRAAELLVQKGLSVNEVYDITGFKSRSNFNKRFKERYHTTPGQYAAQAKKNLNK